MIRLKDLLIEICPPLCAPTALSTTGTLARTAINLSKGGNRRIGDLRQPEVDDQVVDLEIPTVALGRFNSNDAHLIAWRLFQTARSLPSTATDWNQSKALATNIYNEMSGLGSGDTLKLLGQIKTTNQLAAIVKNFNFNGDSLYKWLHGESTISWTQVLVALSKFQNIMNASGIDICKYGGCIES